MFPSDNCKLTDKASRIFIPESTHFGPALIPLQPVSVYFPLSLPVIHKSSVFQQSALLFNLSLICINIDQIGM